MCFAGLPDEDGRYQILEIHTRKLRENKKLALDVDISELAKSTRNFSGAELEGLVRSSESTAMNRLIAVSKLRGGDWGRERDTDNKKSRTETCF